MTTEEVKYDPFKASEAFAVYLIEAASKLQSRVDEVSGSINEKVDEVYQRLDSMERSLKEMNQDKGTAEEQT
ncbi:hypothetical protein EDC96DRAFT_572271 [Choanephora cucurbitarum]|nr:hypothetical protein EDC96DRAFT_572271 [Choanephora cucurbitarum]